VKEDAMQLLPLQPAATGWSKLPEFIPLIIIYPTTVSLLLLLLLLLLPVPQFAKHSTSSQSASL
jgi:hypothetical protein